MDFDIRKNIYDNLRCDDEEDIINLINDSVNNEDEVILPGLGVMLELFWKRLPLKEKEKIAKIIKEELPN